MLRRQHDSAFDMPGAAQRPAAHIVTEHADANMQGAAPPGGTTVLGPTSPTGGLGHPTPGWTTEGRPQTGDSDHGS